MLSAGGRTGPVEWEAMRSGVERLYGALRGVSEEINVQLYGGEVRVAAHNDLCLGVAKSSIFITFHIC